MLQIRKARPDEFSSVLNFYYSLIDSLKGAEFSPLWQKEVYPTREMISSAIAAGQLYVGEWKGRTAACMVVNNDYNPGYDNARWSVPAAREELLVVHLLGVSPALFGNGIAGQMVRSVIDTARESGLKTVRLDVIEGNLPAEKAYTKVGFRYADSLRLYYDDTGWTNFRLFEYVL